MFSGVVVVAWFKLDDSTYDHPKIVPLSDGAFRLWVLAGLYSAKHLTDGVVTAATLTVLQAKPKHVDEIVDAGLWEPQGNEWIIHDWHHYQPSRAEVERNRNQSRKRMQKWRDSHRNDDGTFHD